jgi:hypothetical protein
MPWHNSRAHHDSFEFFPPLRSANQRNNQRLVPVWSSGGGASAAPADSELGVLTSQCLDRRIPNKQLLIDEIAAWEHDRNANHTKADWQFTTKNARIKLKHLYPAI